MMESEEYSHRSMMQSSLIAHDKKSATDASAYPGQSHNDPLTSTMNFNKSQKSSPNTITAFPSVTQASIDHLTKDISKMYTHDQTRHFAFSNQQVANSPYHLIKKFPQG
jgi:hypothetical protein